MVLKNSNSLFSNDNRHPDGSTYTAKDVGSIVFTYVY